MVLMHGTKGMGTAWSTSQHTNYNQLNIIDNCVDRRRLEASLK